ncbi:hypothetical protein MTO96_036346, partial [Rhipicephalus appendiculatus]
MEIKSRSPERSSKETSPNVKKLRQAANKAATAEMELCSNCQELEVEHQRLQSENGQLMSENGHVQSYNGQLRSLNMPLQEQLLNKLPWA